jgi:hypothetical protein
LKGVDKKIMMLQKNKEELTPADLNYLRVSIILALGTPDIRDMPNLEEALEKLYKKVDRLYKEAANK